jgi:RND superfamily putative drug exporter
MLARLARWSFRRRKLMVFGIWLPLLIGINAISGGLGTDFHTDFEIPGGESKQVQDVLSSGASNEDAGFVAQIVFTAPDVRVAAVQSAMTTFFDQVDALEGVKVSSPYVPGGERFISADG